MSFLFVMWLDHITVLFLAGVGDTSTFILADMVLWVTDLLQTVWIHFLDYWQVTTILSPYGDASLIHSLLIGNMSTIYYWHGYLSHNNSLLIHVYFLQWHELVGFPPYHHYAYLLSCMTCSLSCMTNLSSVLCDIYMY